MFERFTQRARHVLVLAQEEARRLGHNFLGTEHVLLALVAEQDGVAGRVLRAMGVDLDRVRREVVTIIGLGPKRGLDESDADALATIGIDLDEVIQAAEEAFGREALERAIDQGSTKRASRRSAPRFTRRAKRVIELSLREALDLGHNYIGTEHLLLALCRLEEGVAPLVLKTVGVERSAVRAAVIEELRRQSA